MRLGQARELFVLAFGGGRADGTAPVYLCAYTSAVAVEAVELLSEKGGIVTDWFTDVGPAKTYVAQGLDVITVPVHGLDAVGMLFTRKPPHVIIAA